VPCVGIQNILGRLFGGPLGNVGFPIHFPKAHMQTWVAPFISACGWPAIAWSTTEHTVGYMNIQVYPAGYRCNLNLRIPYKNILNIPCCNWLHERTSRSCLIPLQSEPPNPVQIRLLNIHHCCWKQNALRGHNKLGY
jgi:hypothetical protein